MENTNCGGYILWAAVILWIALVAALKIFIGLGWWWTIGIFLAPAIILVLVFVFGIEKAEANGENPFE